MASHFPEHVARIWSSGATPSVVGAGFLLEGRFVMTCAHVVAEALGRGKVSRCEVGEIVNLDLPSTGHVDLCASIVAYFPMVWSDRLIDDPVADIAVLRLGDSSVSGGVMPGRVNRRLVPGQHFTTFGFPSGYDQGTPASGEVVVQDFWGWVQVVDKSKSGHFLTPGFSGAPAFAAGGTELIGMVCQSEPDERLRLGALIPADTLCKAWPPLAQPYLRLEKFTEHESDMFFGREEFVTELNGKLGRSPFAVVVGPSGSGKSSVVLAGLVPALRKDEWIVVQCRPLEDPINELASEFARVQIGLDDLNARLDLADKRADWLRKDPRRIFEIAREMSAGARRQKPVLLVIDQFEELFTNDAAAHDGAVRRKDEVTPDHGSPRQKAFLEVLEAIAGQEPGSRLPIRAVATLRADYMDAALRIGSLARLMKDADVKLGPMRTPELTAAIEKPAEHFRVGFENGLVPEIVSEMKGRPGGLPLLQFALDRLWRRQENRRLTWKGYQGEDGRSGLATALDEHAEDVRREIDDDDGLRRVMLQLVRVAEELPDARAVVGRSMFRDADWKLIEILAQERLVMIAIAADGSQTVEVVHEALIGSWTRLTTWLNEDREFRLWHQRLGQALQEYRLDPEGGVLTGRRLAEAEDWLQTHKDRLIEEEVTFVERSKEHSKR
ncbi:serine protease [Paracoccus litorisediminis]|uniref:AAA family ATPase n=1 Tax=Paracoccus litorisediminis TaxID=2006130 RepID=A0A844HR34_9RHOB|nr:serine protease [Paracoccus litorisediminis]MTH60052.1 AAA family ATPase [Paracoccus litorisediminis]